mgnify:CR=1 FL=1
MAQLQVSFDGIATIDVRVSLTGFVLDKRSVKGFFVIVEVVSDDGIDVCPADGLDGSQASKSRDDLVHIGLIGVWAEDDRDLLAVCFDVLLEVAVLQALAELEGSVVENDLRQGDLFDALVFEDIGLWWWRRWVFGFIFGAFGASAATFFGGIRCRWFVGCFWFGCFFGHGVCPSLSGYLLFLDHDDCYREFFVRCQEENVCGFCQISGCVLWR